MRAHTIHFANDYAVELLESCFDKKDPKETEILRLEKQLKKSSVHHSKSARNKPGNLKALVLSSDSLEQNTLALMLQTKGMIALIGIVNAIYLNALSFLVSALLITLIKKSEKIIVSTKMTIASVLQDLKEGFNFAWSHPVLKYGALLFIGSNFAINLFFANFMYYLAHTLALSPAQIGLVFAIIGVGSIAGSLFTPGLLKRFEPGKLISSMTLLAGLISFLLLLTKNPWGVAIIWAIVSGCGSSNVVTYFTLRQQVVPSEYLGRAVATTRLISYSSIPIASILGGWLLGITNIYTIIFWCALLRLVVGLVALFSPLCNAKKKINPETIYDNA